MLIIDQTSSAGSDLMSDVMSLLTTMLEDILRAIYQPFGFAIILAVLFMFVYKHYSGPRAACMAWIGWFRTEKRFRRVFLLAFYTALLLFRTLLNRSEWSNPLSNVIGVWGIYYFSGDQLIITGDAFENILLFAPFIFLLFLCFAEQILKKDGQIRIRRTIWKSLQISFLFSLAIEMLQLIFRLGTWQLSDLVQNTLGGLLGGLVYWMGRCLSRRKHRVDESGDDADQG